jgi:hypothetical protein
VVFPESNRDKPDLRRTEGKPRSGPAVDTGNRSICSLLCKQQSRQQVVDGSPLLDSDCSDFLSRNYACVISRIPDDKIQGFLTRSAHEMINSLLFGR